MKPSIRITSIRANDDVVKIAYQEKVGKSGWSKTTIERPEKARPEFYDALKALQPHVIQICELPKDYIDDITVSGATFSYDDDLHTVGAVIVAKKKLSHSNSPFNIATPHKYEHAADAELKGDSLLFLTKGAANDLRILRDEAVAYIKGERAQGDLFVDGKGEVVDGEGKAVGPAKVISGGKKEKASAK
jgi:hypothetical protein